MVDIHQILTVAVGIGLQHVARSEVGTDNALQEHARAVGLGSGIVGVVLFADIAVVETLIGGTQLVAIV